MRNTWPDRAMSDRNERWPGDFYHLADTLPEEDQALLARLRQYMAERVAAGAIYLCGSDEQKTRGLPSMARLEILSSSGLTELDDGDAGRDRLARAAECRGRARGLPSSRREPARTRLARQSVLHRVCPGNEQLIVGRAITAVGAFV